MLLDVRPVHLKQGARQDHATPLELGLAAHLVVPHRVGIVSSRLSQLYTELGQQSAFAQQRLADSAGAKALRGGRARVCFLSVSVLIPPSLFACEHLLAQKPCLEHPRALDALHTPAVGERENVAVQYDDVGGLAALERARFGAPAEKAGAADR